MPPRDTRRSFLAAGGAAALTALSGCSAVRSRVEGVTGELPDLPGLGGSGDPVLGGRLPEAVEEQGTYNVFVPGSDGENVIDYHYRTHTGPLRMESAVGGLVMAGPTDGGIQLRVDLTDDDVYGLAGFTLGPVDLGRVESIAFSSTAALGLGVLLGIEYNDGSISSWEPAGEDRERSTGFDGDDRALFGPVSGDETPIDRTDAVWSSPPNGGAGELADVSIDDLQERFGDIPVRASGFIDGGPGESSRSVVQEYIVRLRG